jgi:hypothetical protein
MNMRNERGDAPWRYDQAILLGIYNGPAGPVYVGESVQGVRIDYAFWVGHKPSPAEAVHLSRNMASLERRGLVVRLGLCRVALTPAGRAVAKAIDPLRSINVEDLMGGG